VRILCRDCLVEIPTSETTHWYDAVDHALDHHRDDLMAERDEAMRRFTVTTTDPRGVITIRPPRH
jgi:hypothetical protein